MSSQVNLKKPPQFEATFKSKKIIQAGNQKKQ